MNFKEQLKVNRGGKNEIFENFINQLKEFKREEVKNVYWKHLTGEKVENSREENILAIIAGAIKKGVLVNKLRDWVFKEELLFEKFEQDLLPLLEKIKMDIGSQTALKKAILENNEWEAINIFIVRKSSQGKHMDINFDALVVENNSDKFEILKDTKRAIEIMNNARFTVQELLGIPKKDTLIGISVDY